ncbi:MAG: TIM barrel protein, partial [Chloroflexota bacterium]|nr:TIM barrel protein [Chloroflexota bacterium]
MDTLERIRASFWDLEIELPSWGFANSGTRFAIFAQEGAPRDAAEKVDDAARVARFTGSARSVALHIPWDRVDDYEGLASYARERGIRIGGINSNTFQDPIYRLGSLCHPDPKVRRAAVAHMLECCDIMRATGSDVLKVWLGDGTNYPGQDDIRARRHRLIESLREVYAALPEHGRLLLEYKLYEPSLYQTDVQDWGTALNVCEKLGHRAAVVVDLGHHAQSVNIEHIVATLLDEGRLGGFDLNDRKYGDDDLMVGSIDPYQLFRILHEIVKASHDPDERIAVVVRRVVYMIDQSHNIEPKVPAMIRSVMNLQEAYAKALLVDLGALRAAQESGDVLEANAVLRDA